MAKTIPSFFAPATRSATELAPPPPAGYLRRFMASSRILSTMSA